MGINSILKNSREIEDAAFEFDKAAIYISAGAKAWDMWKAFDFIRCHQKKDAFILDVGTFKSRMLEVLYCDGYRNLYGCDIGGVEWSRPLFLYLRRRRFWDLARWLCQKGPIHLSRQDLQKTKYAASQFDCITSISVIEHGVDSRSYLKEMSRLLKPGGYLITSCDYWPESISTVNYLPYGLSWNIQSQKDIEGLIILAGDYNLIPVEPMDFTCGEPIVKWNEREYTFAFLVLKKTDCA